jgi:hypothetical protein
VVNTCQPVSRIRKIHAERAGIGLITCCCFHRAILLHLGCGERCYNDRLPPSFAQLRSVLASAPPRAKRNINPAASLSSRGAAACNAFACLPPLQYVLCPGIALACIKPCMHAAHNLHLYHSWPLLSINPFSAYATICSPEFPHHAACRHTQVPWQWRCSTAMQAQQACQPPCYSSSSCLQPWGPSAATWCSSRWALSCWLQACGRSATPSAGAQACRTERPVQRLQLVSWCMLSPASTYSQHDCAW